jgi:hypothetical protein
MRTFLLSLLCVLLLSICAYLGAEPGADAITIRVQLRDAETDKPMPGIVRVFAGDGPAPVPLPGLYNRLKGMEKTAAVAGWHVVGADGATIAVPRGKLRIEALAGLETALAREEIDAKDGSTVPLRLPFVFRPEQRGLAAGNTHLHLRNMTLAEADDYLRQIPAADRLHLLFISYLERHKDDATYITNRYPAGDLKQFDKTGVLLNNGEEHRHNFEAYGQGYGHVMLLNINRFIKPASNGPGITGEGFDDTPLQPGIEVARRQGGTIIWCHNTNGYEATPNVLAGRLDALNVFDGSRSGSFEDRYYRYLNVGLRLPISTGTDWFMYDFARVYAKLAAPLSVKGWLDAVKAGRTVATNGPLLTLKVDDKEPGDVLKLDAPRTVKVEATGVGRLPFGQLQLVHNGKVIKAQAVEAKQPGHFAKLVHELRIDEPGWLALRIESTTKNELGHVLFAHTSPVYIDLAGKRIFHVETARLLLKELEEARAAIRAKGKFSAPAAQERLLGLYEEASRELLRQLNQRGG